MKLSSRSKCGVLFVESLACALACSASVVQAQVIEWGSVTSNPPYQAGFDATNPGPNATGSYQFTDTGSVSWQLNSITGAVDVVSGGSGATNFADLYQLFSNSFGTPPGSVPTAVSDLSYSFSDLSTFMMYNVKNSQPTSLSLSALGLDSNQTYYLALPMVSYEAGMGVLTVASDGDFSTILDITDGSSSDWSLGSGALSIESTGNFILPIILELRNASNFNISLSNTSSNGEDEISAFVMLGVAPQAVPEPSSAILFAFVGFAFFIRRRR